MSRISLAVAMGTGTAGALEDQTTYADLTVGITRSWGRTSEFEDFPPGEFSFTLENGDGRFTPDNPSSPLTTKVTEGMAVCCQFGSKLVAGQIRSIEPTFPDDESSWAQVTITADDTLGPAGRRSFESLQLGMVSDAYAYWALDEDAAVSEAAESSGNNQPALAWQSTGVARTVVDGIFTGELQAVITTDNAPTSAPAGVRPFATCDFAPTSMGAWGCWMTPQSGFTTLSETVTVSVSLGGGVGEHGFGLWKTASGIQPFLYLDGVAGGGRIYGPVVSIGEPVNIVTTKTISAAKVITAELFVNGVSYGTQSFTSATSLTNAQRTPRVVAFTVGFGSSAVAAVSHLSFTPSAVFESLLLTSTEAAVLTALARAAGATLAPLPAGLSVSPIGLPSDMSVLDGLNEVIRGEQGHIYANTTGTITAPTQSLVVRERDRPAGVDYTFDLEEEVQGSPEFVRDITNMISQVTVDGPDASILVVDSRLVGRVGSANAAEKVLLEEPRDLQAWGEDRLNRGANTKLRVATLTIDALTTPTDRSADLLAMVPGDRVQVIGLPSTQLGFTTWDGWLLGAEETHTLTEHTFVLALQPVLPATAVFDTAVFDTDLFAF